MYTLSIAGTIKKMTVNELRDSVFENYYKRIAFVNKSSYYSLKCSKKKCYCLQPN